MSCNSCLKKYGFLCKETGCPNCGFSYCTKCLKKTIEVPRLNGAQKKVCLKCWDTLSTKPSLEIPKTPGPPPEILSPIDQPIPDEIQANLDDIIQQRLIALKQTADHSHSSVDADKNIDETIAIRVANLKDIPHCSSLVDNRNILREIDTRTDEEKTADLIKQFMGEVEIDQSALHQQQSIDPIKEIEIRLRALRDETHLSPSVVGTATSDEENEDDEIKIKKITEKYLDEGKLWDGLTAEEREFIESTKNTEETNSVEELPWCHICNEDARLRCLDCDGDLFCISCFKEFHVDEEDRNHRTETYVAKKIST